MIHIAYIDPDETARFTFEQIAILLHARGIANETRTYAQLDYALEELATSRPHIAFIDVRARTHAYPFDGLALVRAVRHYPLCRHTVLVGLARYAMPADETAARGAGCDEFLPKPVRYQAVEDLLIDHLFHVLR